MLLSSLQKPKNIDSRPNMRKLIFLLWCFLFVACSDDDSPIKPVEQSPLTVCAYLIANNNLDDELLANVGAMYDGLAELSYPATLLIYWDGKTGLGPNQATHAILKYETDGEGNINGTPALDDTYFLDDVLEVGEIVKEYPIQLSTTKEVMSSVLKDMINLAPTENVGLIAGSHGSAWINNITLSRSFGQDGSYTENTILISDMAEAMKATGKVFDFLLFDACYMGTIEVCHALREAARYQIVSALEVPAYGFPYENMLKELYTGTTSGYTQACQLYIDYYKELYRQYVAGESYDHSWGTVALVDSKEIPSLASLIKEEIVTHKDALADYDVSGLQEYGKKNGEHISFDLGNFIKELNGNILPADFQSQLDKTIIYKGCLEKASPSYFNIDTENYCGLGIYVPVASRPQWNAYFQTTEWYTVAGWDQVSFSWMNEN